MGRGPEPGGGRVRPRRPLAAWGRARFGGRASQAGIHRVTSTEPKGQGEEGTSCHRGWGEALKTGPHSGEPPGELGVTLLLGA